jgi:hypothetical protein|tara:strand:+ start:954 stop:1295 length:342 start_codon:yes stop_codon:yes gene_type:complete
MGMLNLGSSVRYGPHGKRRKTKAFSTKSKSTKYNELIERQQVQYDQVMSRLTEEYPSFVPDNLSVSNPTPRRENLMYTGERQLIGIGVMHKSNLVPVFKEDKQYAKDLARMRR